jgi:hypothetical protein
MKLTRPNSDWRQPIGNVSFALTAIVHSLMKASRDHTQERGWIRSRTCSAFTTATILQYSNKMLSSKCALYAEVRAVCSIRFEYHEILRQHKPWGAVPLQSTYLCSGDCAWARGGARPMWRWPRPTAEDLNSKPWWSWCWFVFCHTKVSWFRTWRILLSRTNSVPWNPNNWVLPYGYI